MQVCVIVLNDDGIGIWRHYVVFSKNIYFKTKSEIITDYMIDDIINSYLSTNDKIYIISNKNIPVPENSQLILAYYPEHCPVSPDIIESVTNISNLSSKLLTSWLNSNFS